MDPAIVEQAVQVVKNCPIESAMTTIFWVATTVVTVFGLAFGIIVRFLYMRIKDVDLETTKALNALRKDFEKGLKEQKELCKERQGTCSRNICRKVDDLGKRIDKMELTTSEELKRVGETMISQGKALVQVAEHMNGVDTKLDELAKKIDAHHGVAPSAAMS
jgi:hypothetical protein